MAASQTQIVDIREMESNEEVWADWLKQDNEYAINDRKSMEAGAGKYLNFIKIVFTQALNTKIPDTISIRDF